MIQVQRAIPDPGNPDLRVYFSRTELTQKTVAARRGDRVRPCDREPVLTTVMEIPGVMSSIRLLTTFNLGEGSLESLL